MRSERDVDEVCSLCKSAFDILTWHALKYKILSKADDDEGWMRCLVPRNRKATMQNEFMKK